jgi:hypothetical protein
VSRLYDYVGPADILAAVRDQPAGAPIKTSTDLASWLHSNGEDADDGGVVVATFIVGADDVLRLASRRTEHVACASGGPVKSAGEIGFSRDGHIVSVSNQSTGFCPESDSWAAVVVALEGVVDRLPEGFSSTFTFRRCPACSQILIIKDNWFVCDVCDADIPKTWNFDV